MSKKIIWIASYPKSGNTYVRSILSSLLYSKNGNFNFNLLDIIELFEQIKNFNFIKNIDKRDYKNLHRVEILSKYWLEAQNKIINQKKPSPIYNIFKTHNSNLYVNSKTFTSDEFTSGVIYIIRDPREIAISYAKHMGKSIDQTIKIMFDEKTSLKPSTNAVTSLISTWDLHYKSWRNLKVPKLILKYEDLLDNNEDCINKLIIFLSNLLQIKKEDLNNKKIKTIETTHIDVFREHESKFGFNESSKNTNFFGTAEKNSWKKILSKDQIKEIEKKFCTTMQELGYNF